MTRTGFTLRTTKQKGPQEVPGAQRRSGSPNPFASEHTELGGFPSRQRFVGVSPTPVTFGTSARPTLA